MPITRLEVLVQRTGLVWYTPWRVDPLQPNTQLGRVYREGKGWRFKCADCTSFYGPIRRTRREALQDLIEHWNEGNK